MTAEQIAAFYGRLRLADADADTPNVLASLMQRLPEAAGYAALESLEHARANGTPTGPLRSEAGYVNRTFQRMVSERQYVQ